MKKIKIEKCQKQPPRGILRKRRFVNMQLIYKRTPMPKYDFIKVALQLYWNHTSAWVFSYKLSAYFSKHVLLRTPQGGCFWNMHIYCIAVERVFVFPGPRPSACPRPWPTICIYRPWPPICIYRPWPPICI